MTTTVRLLGDLTVDEFFEVKDGIRAAFDADTFDGFTFHRTDGAEGRYTVRFRGVNIGWVWRDHPGRWDAWAVNPRTPARGWRTDQGARTRRDALESIRNSVAIYGFTR